MARQKISPTISALRPSANGNINDGSRGDAAPRQLDSEIFYSCLRRLLVLAGTGSAASARHRNTTRCDGCYSSQTLQRQYHCRRAEESEELIRPADRDDGVRRLHI